MHFNSIFYTHFLHVLDNASTFINIIKNSASILDVSYLKRKCLPENIFANIQLDTPKKKK